MSPEELDNIRNLYRAGRIEPQHVAALLNELDRVRAMVPRLEWCTRIDVEEATPGDFGLVVGGGGWTLEFFDKRGDATQVDSGPQTGEAGKREAEAAYGKAAGL